jgi:ATP-binding cassette, subfamily B, bacterial PglK
MIKSVQEGFGGIKALQASNSTSFIEREYVKRRREYAGVRYRINLYQQLPTYYMQGVMIGGVAIFVTIVILRHTGNLGALIGIIIASFVRLLPSLYQTLSSVGSIRSAEGNVEMLYDELRRMQGSQSESVADEAPEIFEEEAEEDADAAEEPPPPYGQQNDVARVFRWTPEDEAREFIHRRRHPLPVDDVYSGPRSVRGLVLGSGGAKRRRLAASADVAPLQWDRSLRFDHVGFRYPGSPVAALDDVSFEIPKGSFVGIVGPSGAGKTTMVDLMLGLFEPTAGRIRIDDTVLAEPAVIDAWRRCVGYVPQDVFLIDASVRDNVTFGSGAGGGDDAVWEALEAAQIADFVTALPGRLNTLLGERGVKISGGQRQRFGIARALYRRPEILILDEATSSLDTATEAALVETVRNLELGNLTRVAVAHRLSTIRDCNALFLFEEGRLVGSGDFSSLRRENAMFDHLARLARID